MYHHLTKTRNGTSPPTPTWRLETSSLEVMSWVQSLKMIYSLNTESWYHPRCTERLLKSCPRLTTLYLNQLLLLNLKTKKEILKWVTSGPLDSSDQLPKNYQARSHFLLVKEFWTPCSLQCKVELALFQVPSVAVKLVFLKPCLNIQTLNVLFTSDVEKEEMKWQKCLTNSQNWQLKSMESNTISCRELAWSLTPQTCQSPLERPQFIQVLPLLNISEIWVSTWVWWLTQPVDGLRLLEKSLVVSLKCLLIQVIPLI